MTTIRSVTVQPNDGSSPTVTAVTPGDATAAQVGDTLLIIHGNDFYPFANMGTPTVTPTATVVAVPDGSADSGDTGAHIRAYTATVTGAGAQTVSVTETGDANEEKALTVYVLAGADAASPVDDAAGVFGASSTPQPAPAVVPATADALLICHVNSGGGNSTASYTSPGSMTEQYEIHVGGLSGVGASEQLASAGDTGTRTFTAATSVPWAAVSIAIRSASGGGGEADAAEATASAATPDPAPRVDAQAQAALAAGEALFEAGTRVSVTLISDAPIEAVASAESAAAAVVPPAGVAAAAAAAVDAVASSSAEEHAQAAEAAAACAAPGPAVLVAVAAGVASAAGAALAASGPGVQVSAGRMGVRVRRGPEIAARSRRAAAMTGGG